jgi:hypothetical protein
MYRIKKKKYFPITIRKVKSSSEEDVATTQTQNFFSSIFGHQNPGSGQDPDPDRYSA